MTSGAPRVGGPAAARPDTARPESPTESARLLGVDLGGRRIGLAVAEPDGRIRPLATLSRRRTVAEDAAVLAGIVRQERIAELIVGLPLEADGREGEQAAETRRWAEAVAAQVGLPLVLRDERWTSERAAERLPRLPRGRSGGPPSRARRTAHRARLDREAAVLILEAELAARREDR